LRPCEGGDAVRFLFYDCVTGIDKSKSIAGTKTFSLSEEFLRGHFKKRAYVPGVIFIEAMAQLLGWLIICSHDFKLSAVMSLIEDVMVPANMRPGFKADIRAEIISTSNRDSIGKASIFVDGSRVAHVNRIIFSHVHKVNPKELAERFLYYSGLSKEQAGIIHLG
jgi:3-hydroxyacyl-[acyl-carrier-protein] dehydratase